MNEPRLNALLHEQGPQAYLASLLRDAARRTPGASALEGPDGGLSYAELLQATEALSSQLRAQGFRAGERIAIAATRSRFTIVAILAAVDAGLGYVPLDLAYPADRLQAMLQDAQPRAVLGQPDDLAELARLAGPFPTLDAPAPAGGWRHAAEPDLTYVLFTSGSTGRPKGVAMGAEPLAHLIRWHVRHPRLGRAARTLQFAPLSFDVHFQEIFSTLACGGTLVLVPEQVRRDPARLHAALQDQRIARIFLPYVALQMIAQASQQSAPAALRDVVSAGEQLQVTPAIRALFRQLPQAVLHNHYGPTESHVVTACELPGEAAQWPEIPSIGAALPHVRLALRDPETGAIDASDTGELLLGGPTLAHGYLGREDLSRERFLDDAAGLPGRWYRTGDLVRRDAQGVYTYLGRADQQLKVDGFRIEAGEIELALMAHPAVRDAVVTAPELPGIGRQLVAHLVLRDPAAASEAIPGLRAHLRARLPEYMVPVRFVPLAALPTTPSGKIDRRGLPLPAAASVAAGASARPAEVVRSLWQELLGVPQLGEHENLFDLGARSLLVLRFVGRLKEAGFARVSVADVYDRPTVAGIAAVCEGGTGTHDKPQQARMRPADASPTQGIAIVGMASRTPGAADTETFWRNLLDGVEGIRHFAPHELDESIPESVRQRPDFVAARGVLDDADRFDAGFFGISAREAAVLDPQQRLLLELCWTALEHAAIDPARGAARIGVYAGSANNTYAPLLRQEDPGLLQRFGEFNAMLASEKDYVAPRVAHRLNLHGPAVSIHTACSTGLVAVGHAWHALASGQCDVALAGGVTVHVPQANGYLHVEGGMESADGHCRPFDADASGTVFASGGGVVVLKRLEDALAEGDTVYAVIRGVGLNNDGGDKASFTAPSVSGQARAIRMALDHAGLPASSIGYVEAHGTGTALGDPIEVAALTRAYREDTAERQFCGLGSLKGNLGHMVAAAGVMGLIKAALSLHRETIPATLHFKRPNPQIDFDTSPFHVVATRTAWTRRPDTPRRAAVSSFGVGGTNAHVVLEEAPAAAPRPQAQQGRRWVLPLSARDDEAVLRRARMLADHLAQHPDTALADVAATLMRGRRPMGQRLSVVAASVAEAVQALRAVQGSVAVLARPRVVFLFPGQGSQHPGMARGLYEEAPAFREALDRSLALVHAALGIDLRACLVEAEPGDPDAARLLTETRHAQPALFAVSYALAVWLDSVGVRPDAMIGHSVGEYAAACHAGVLSLEDATMAVIARGQAMFAQPPGAMLAARCDADTLLALLPAGVDLAACNAPALSVAAGPADAIDRLASLLEARGIGCTRLQVSHAFHSASMEGALPQVTQALQRAVLRAPAIPLYSCVSGTLLQADEAADPAYWARQVRAPVQFSRAVQAELAHAGDTVFVEVGPGQALTALLRQHRTPSGKVPHHVPLLGTAGKPGDPATHALSALGSLWNLGLELAWPVAASARRVPLPTYPFKDERHWFSRRACASPADAALSIAPSSAGLAVTMNQNRLPRLEQELKRILSDVSGLPEPEIGCDTSFVDQGLDSLSLTQATLELERVFGVKLRFRRLLEDLDNIDLLARHLDAEVPAGRFAPEPAPAPMAAVQPTSAIAGAPVPPAGTTALQQLIQQQMQLMSQQLAALAGQPAAAAIGMPASRPAPAPAQAAEAGTSLVDKPFGASPRLTLQANQAFTPPQRAWLDDFIRRYNARSGQSKAFSQQHRRRMADPRVVTGFNPLWKDLVYPLVVNRSQGARLWDLDGNEYIDLLSGFGANLLGYQPASVVSAMTEQLQAGIEVGPQHPMAAEVADLISEFTGMERVGFCNTGSEAVMGAMRIARTVTGRKTIAIFTNSYHGIFDEVIVRGTRQLRSLSAAPGILANAVENILVLDWDSEDSLRVLRERAPELAAIMTEPVQNKFPTVQPRAFIQSLRDIADQCGCALIFDEVVTGFRLAPGGAQAFYGVRADVATYGKIIGGGLPFAAIAGGARWLDALDGGHWQYGDDSYPEAGVTYFAGTFVRHPLALAAARATLLHLKQGGAALYQGLNDRTQRLIDRLNTAFRLRGAPVEAVHCASLWRLSWDDNQKFVSLFYYLARFHGLHLYEQFGHFVTEAMGDAETDRIFQVFCDALDELMGLGLITPRDGGPVPPHRALPSAPRTEAPLSPGQTERWLAGGFDAAARRALNESFWVSLQGDVDLPALKLALQDVLARHEALRVRFSLEDPVQTLAPVGPVPVAEVDLSAQADAESALDAFCTEASRRDFPLDQAPLAAVSLLTLAGGRRVVHMVASHLVFDGWASSVFNSELAAAYQARRAGQRPQFKPAESPLQFAVEEQARFEGPQGQDDLRFWTETLRQPPEPLRLGDREPPQPRTYAADTLRTRLDGKVFAGLKRQARTAQATLFQLLLAAVTAVLHRRSGQSEFVVSIPYASQSLQRRGPLLADGVLDLPLRLRCDAPGDAVALLESVREHLMDALEHPLVTQGTVARALGLRSTGNRPPLTGIYFNLNPRVDLSGYAPLVATLHEGRKRGSLSELFFNFYEGDDALALDLHYSSEFFSPQRAQELVDALVAQCVAWAESLSGAVIEVAVPPLAKVDPRLQTWNATAMPLAAGSRVEQWVSRQAADTPEAPALVAQGRVLSYRALEARADRLAHVLGARGVGRGTRVGVCLGRGLELLPVLLAVMKTGAAYVPLDPGFPRERLRYMEGDAGLTLVVTEAAHAGLSGLPRDRQFLVDEDAALVSGAPDTPFAAPAGDAHDAPAYVIYTSGSTGRPKGVVVPQQAVCNFLASMRRAPGLHAGDRLLAVTTLSFDIAVLELFLPLTTGACVVLAQREDAMDGEALAGLISGQRVNVMQATPTTWHLLLDSGWKAPWPMRVLCGGEPLPPSLAARLLAAGVELWNMYGPTETTVWSTLARITDARHITIGSPIANTQVWVLDEQGQPCAVGTEGEICIGGAGVASGYFNRPELTRERFIADPFSTEPGACLYRTGDLGRWRGDGTLDHLGRLDHQVKVRGYRIELGEIEACLGDLPGIARTVVVAREDLPGEVTLVAYFVAQAGASPDPAVLRQALRTSLPEYMVPQHLVALPGLPLLPNGKIDRKALPAPAGTSPVAAPVAPTPADILPGVQQVAQAMAEVLGVATLAPDAHFFELGGHSLQAARLASRLSAAAGQRITLRTLFENPTPARLAQALARLAPAAAPREAMRIAVRAQQRYAPLSLMQQRLWFLENMTPGTPFNQLPSAHRLRGPLDLAAFQQAFQQLVDRQGALRTVIERTPEGPRQRVLDSLPVQFGPVDDLRGLPAAEREAAARARLDELALAPLDFEHGPLFRVHLLQLGEREHVFFFMVHHFVWDGSSFDLLYHELAELYSAVREQRAPRLPDLRVSYGDYAEWQRDWMQGDELAQQLAGWREALTPLPEVLELPTDRPRPAHMSGEGASCLALLPPDLAEALHRLARAQGCTLSTLLLATYALQLHRWSGQHDFVVATPVRGREQPDLEQVMGFFVNALPLRMRPQGKLGFEHWVRQVQGVVTAAFASPDVPFEHLVQALDVPRDASRPLLAQALYSFQDVRERPQAWSDLEHSRFDIGLHGASHDVSLFCVELNGGIECSLTYNSDVFDQGSMVHFLRRFEHLLRQVVADPSCQLAVFQLATPAEIATLEAWNGTALPYDRSACLHQFITRCAQDLPDASAPAVTQPGVGSMVRAEFESRTNRLAHVLRSRGIARGALVGLCVERGIDMLVAQIAILKAGAAYVPLDPGYPSERLAYMAEDARLALLVTDAASVHVLAWPRERALLLDIDAAAISLHPDVPLPPAPALDATADDPAYVIYTSGSTGRPKGVVVPHRAVVNFLSSMARQPGLASSDRFVAVTTLSFDIAVLELLLPLCTGAELILAGRDTVMDGHALRALLESSAATAMQATPATWRMLIDSGWQGTADFKALIGGEALPVDLAQQLVARTGQLWNMYGPTETTVWSTCWCVERPVRSIGIGRPIANTRLHVLDERMQPCPIGVPGEIYLGGDGVALGYLHAPQVTAERFGADPFHPGGTLYRTGDRGRWRHDGVVEHFGRLDFQVKVRGHRIELGEIESILGQHRQVARTLVIVREDRPGDARLVAYVVPRGEMPAAGALREHLRASLPDYMLPQHFVALSDIPLLPNGKIDRHALPPPSDTDPASHAGRALVAPRTAAEISLARIWTGLLGVGQLSVTDNFFDLGGHSLLAMRAVIDIEKDLGVRLNVRRLIFESLEQLAAGIEPLPETAPAQPLRASAPRAGLWRRLVQVLRHSPSDRRE